MNDQPLVSVIVPCYNHERFVSETIVSILNQTYKNIELLVIDDGSKDNSSTILKELSAQHHFYFEVQKNQGICATLNKLIGMSKGKYVAAVASDDTWLLDKIEKQVRYLEQNAEVGACFGNTLSINEDNDILPYYFQRFTKHMLYTFEDVISLSAHLSAPTAMYRKQVFDKIGLYDSRFLLEDLYMNLKATDKNFKLAVLPDLMTFYRVHGSNLSKNREVMFKEKLKLLNCYKDKPGYRKGLIKTYIHYCVHVAFGILPNAWFPFKRS